MAGEVCSVRFLRPVPLTALDPRPDDQGYGPVFNGPVFRCVSGEPRPRLDDPADQEVSD